MSTDDPLLPLAKVAELANVTEAKVRKWISDGELAAERVGDTWVIRTSVIEKAPYEAAIPVRMAFNRARMDRFRATQTGEVVPAPLAPPRSDMWKPADVMVSPVRLTELRGQLESLWVPEPRGESRAHPPSEWPITATFASPLSAQAVDAVLARPWQIDAVVFSYGLAADGARWTSCTAPDRPSAFRMLELGVFLDESVTSPAVLEAARAEIVKRCHTLGADTVVEQYPLADAFRRAEALQDLSRSVAEDRVQTIFIHGDAPYSEEAVAELLYALGFEDSASSTWAWKNREGCLGDWDIISAAHDARETVTLSLDVLRVASPVRVARVALDIARTLQGALGGALHGESDDETLDSDDWLKTIESIAATLGAAGFECGGTAMRIL